MNPPKAPVHSRARSSLWNFAKIVIAGLLILYVFSRTDLSALRSTLENLSFHWLIILILVFLALTLLKAFQYHVLLEGRLTYPEVLNVVIVQNAISNFLATGAGIVSLLASLQVEHDVKMGRSLVMFLLTKIGDLFAIWLALLISSYVTWPKIQVLHLLAIALILGIGSILVIFLLTAVYRQRAVTWIATILDRFKLSSVGIIAKALGTLRSLAEVDFRQILLKLLLSITISVVYLGGTVLFLYASLMVFDIKVRLDGMVFVTALVQILSYVPIQVFGGIGVSETSNLYLFGFFDVAEEVLAPALIGSRLLFYFLNLIPLLYLPIYTAFLAKRGGG